METASEVQPIRPGRSKFLIGGLLIVAAVVFLIWNSTQSSIQYYLTVDELHERGEDWIGKDVRVAGAVIGDSINYDPKTLELSFRIVHIPADVEKEGGLAEALHVAVTDPSRHFLNVVYIGAMPDLMQHEAQAIVTGQVDELGMFTADELLLKCPTRYEEAVSEEAST